MQSNYLVPLLLSLIAGLSTAIGSLASVFIKRFKPEHTSIALGFSAGVMIYVSMIEIMGGAITSIGFMPANIAFFAGIILIFLIDHFIPHTYKEEKSESKKLMRIGLVTAIGLAIHNFPEGIAVAMASLKSLSLGIPIAIAIIIHNIPEGISVAMPIYYATKSRKKAVLYSALSGIAEPVGALISIMILAPFINDSLLNIILAAVAGIMVFISFDELLPYSFHKNRGHYGILGLFLGMLVMAASLNLLT